ncbi:MAG: hypothetical protein JWQ14_1022 [Adhaeribacter sp.]|nr:hypothetical protein [Adhaeribacter sp.]
MPETISAKNRYRLQKMTYKTKGNKAMKNSMFKYLPAILLAGVVNVTSLQANPTVPALANDKKELTTVLQDTITNKARAKRGVSEVGSGAKEVGKGTKDLAVSGAKATGKGAKKAGKAVKNTTKKGVKKVENAVD